jgi:glucose/arabinose dehydrogenase
MRAARRTGSFLTAVAVALGAAAACTPEPRAPSSARPVTPSAPVTPRSPATVPSRSPAPEPVAFDPSSVRLRLRPVVEGLSAPLALTYAGDSSGRIFVAEQGGRILWFRKGETETHEFLDLSDRTLPGGERGLLGLAFHPEYEDNGRLFVDYTDQAGDTVIEEFRAAPAGAARADPNSGRVLLTFDQPYANHNGGHLAFGLDGYLYIASGDGGSGGDPHDYGQSLDTLLGKILRIDVDAREGNRPYSTPSDNPFVDETGARPEIWAYGLRNPWRFSFDRVSQELWIGDVGQNVLEEINRAPSGDAGINYGWNELEGTECYEPTTGCSKEGTRLPVTQYSHEFGCSVTGGFVYRGSTFPALQGGYFFSDYCSGTLWAIPAGARPGRPPFELLETEYSISSFGEDEDGELYVTDLSAGAVFQLTGERR